MKTLIKLFLSTICLSLVMLAYFDFSLPCKYVIVVVIVSLLASIGAMMVIHICRSEEPSVPMHSDFKYDKRLEDRE